MRAFSLVLVAALLCGLATTGAGEPLKAGDMAVVTRDNAEIKMGSQVVAYLAKGQKVKIHWVQGGWARVWFTIKGESKVGHVSLKDLEPLIVREEKGPSKNPFVVDDQIVVIAKEAKLMLGAETLGTIPEGTRLTVKKVKDDWLGVTANVKGKTTFGWLHARDVDYPPVGEKAPPGKEDAPKGKERETEEPKG